MENIIVKKTLVANEGGHIDIYMWHDGKDIFLKVSVNHITIKSEMLYKGLPNSGPLYTFITIDEVRELERLKSKLERVKDKILELEQLIER
jgi:hypothetical protein